MAAVLHRPTLCAFLYPPPALASAARTFATSSRRCDARMAAIQKQAKSLPSIKAPKLAQREEMGRMGLPNDTGLIQGKVPALGDARSARRDMRVQDADEWAARQIGDPIEATR